MDVMPKMRAEPLEQLTEDDLPEEIKQMLEKALEKARERKFQRITEIGSAIIKRRDEAINARAGSGIETDWLEDDEYYDGVDDANREEVARSRERKGTTLLGTVTPINNASPVRSTVFLNITRPYTDAAAARVGDMLIPTDDRNWAFKPTPKPEIEKAKNDMSPVEGFGTPGPDGQTRQATAADFAKNAIVKAMASALAAQDRVDDWLVQCQYHAEMRKVIEDCSRLGTGVLKGPSPVKRKARIVKTEDGVAKLIFEQKIDPASVRVDPWKFYPDPTCGEDIHKGRYVFEEDDLNARQLKDLKELPGSLSDQIDKVLVEGPKRTFAGMRDADGCHDDEMFKAWHYHGYLDREDLTELGIDEDLLGDMIGAPIVATLVNDTIIKAALNPLESGEFPYDVMPWQRRVGSLWGRGVSRQIRVPQDIINAATRNMMDNAGISGGPILVIKRGKITPADGNWNLTPRKIFFAADESDMSSVADSIMSIVIPSMQAELMNIVQFGLKMAEDVTWLPMIMQGQLGKAPDTVGGMQMLQNSASAVLRRIAKQFDDYITEPHMRRYYEYLLLYGEDDAEKGDYQIDARGSSALVERDLQNQAVMQMGALVKDPTFGLSPAKWMAEWLKSQRLDPKRFELDDEEKDALKNQPPPEAPQVAVAKIRSETDLKRTQVEAEVDLQRIKVDTDRDTIYVQAEAEQNASEHQARMTELQVKRELAMLEYANRNKQTLDQIKADLAKESMRLTTQKQLAAASNAAAQVATPAIEPQGRAPNGQAFQR